MPFVVREDPSIIGITSIEDDGIWTEKGRSYTIEYLGRIAQSGEVQYDVLFYNASLPEPDAVVYEVGDDTYINLDYIQYIWDFNDEFIIPKPSPLCELSSETIITQPYGLDSKLYQRTITIDSSMPDGNYILMYYGVMRVWNGFKFVATDIENLLVYPITIGTPTPEVPSTIFPAARPDDYDPDVIWNPTGGDDGTGGWTSTPADLTTLGGGRYNQQLIAIGNKKIYYGAL